MPEIKWIGSTNYWKGRNGKNIYFIVDHISQGAMSSMDNWFNNSSAQASAHFGISKLGEIHQYVNTSDTAWSNGIITDYNNPVSEECDDSSDKYFNPNYYTVSIEHEGMSGNTLTEAQYQASLWLHKKLINEFNIKVDRNHIIGHYRIDPINKSGCPGSGFPWDRLFKDLTGSSMSNFTIEEIYKLMKVTVDTLNVRELPTTDSKILGQYKLDNTPWVDGKTTVNGEVWYRIRYYNDVPAYLYGAYLEDVNQEQPESISTPDSTPTSSKQTGIEFLKSKGLFKSDHDPKETITAETLGLVMRNLFEKMGW